MAGLSIQDKRDFHVLRWLVLGLIGVILLTAGYYAYQWYTTGEKPPIIPLPAVALANPSIDEAPIPQEQIDSYTVPATHPRYISIPALGVDKARVVTVGLTKNNVLDTPSHIADTAWYTKSATPGQGYGVVVIDGHNGGISRDGVFVNLDKLNTDDKIIVERGDGKQFTYRVVENKTMSVQDANTTGMQELMKPYDSTKEGLGLITCAGNWVPRDKIFNERIIVRAVIES